MYVPIEPLSESAKAKHLKAYDKEFTKDENLIDFYLDGDTAVFKYRNGHTFRAKGWLVDNGLVKVYD